MRRTEKEITDKSVIEAIVHQAIVCRVGLCDGDRPYIVPMCFGYRDTMLFVHGALEGRKIAVLRKNNKVCFELEINTAIVEGESACQWGMRYQCVIGFGNAFFLEDSEDKRRALDIIMQHYSDKPFLFPEKAIKKTAVIKIAIDRMTGKQSGF